MALISHIQQNRSKTYFAIPLSKITEFTCFRYSFRIMTSTKSVDLELSENYGMKDNVNNKGASGIRFDYVCLNLTLMRL